MKFIHISDLHIGKRVNEFSMVEDQKYILNEILDVIQREQPDGILMAGDLYDKPVPPAEAVSLLDEFFTRLADLEISVFAVSGNHDSAERIAFGSRLMNSRGVYVSPVYNGTIEKISMEDSHGQVWVYLMPFLRPAAVRRFFPEEEIHTYQQAVETAISHLSIDRTKRNVLVAHQFVTGASRCESEEISVGGMDQVDSSVFEAFDYVALGHLHSPQHVGRKEICYCGTPLKYSFSEAEQEKSLTVVELKEKGEVELRTIPLKPLRDMRKVKGTYLQVTDRSFYQNTNTEDYLKITLTDEEDIPDGMQKLRIIYPNLMRLEYDNRRTREQQNVEGARAVEEKTSLELFEEFYFLQNNQEMSSQQRTWVKHLMEELQEKEGRKP